MITAAPLLATATEPASAVEPLSDVFGAAGAEPVRFILIDGKTVIGRVVRIETDALTIRRPSGGLTSLSVNEIVGVNVKSADGGLLRGQIVRLANGDIGWATKDDAAATIEHAGSLMSETEETGGPLIRLDNDALPPDALARGSSEGTAEAEPAEQLVAATPGDTPAGGAEPVRLTVTADPVSEDDKLIYFQLELSEPARQSVLIIYTTIDGTAAAPGDFTHRQGVVVFEPGQTRATVATSITDDTVAEGAERFTFFVTGDPGSVVIEERKVVATIDDNDG